MRTKISRNSADRRPVRLQSIMAAGLALACVTALTGCAPNSGGVRGETAFNATAAVTEIDADVPLAAFARCFRTRATFLPLSKFEQDENRFVYRLQAEDLWLEEMTVTATPSGITGELRVSGIYDKGWRDMLERDRLPALALCQTKAGIAGVTT